MGVSGKLVGRAGSQAEFLLLQPGGGGAACKGLPDQDYLSDAASNYTL